MNINRIKVSEEDCLNGCRLKYLSVRAEQNFKLIPVKTYLNDKQIAHITKEFHRTKLAYMLFELYLLRKHNIDITNVEETGFDCANNIFEIRLRDEK